MNTEMETLAKQLFNALDDTVLAQYYEYKRHGGEYPSERSTDALISALSRFGPSKALNKMLARLPKDILRSQHEHSSN